MGFEISRLIGQQRIGRRVRLVESVAGELVHLVEQFSGNIFWMAQRRCAAHKAVALLGHLFGLLFAHGAAQQIGFAQRVAGDDVRDLHHLFLIDDDTQRLFQDAFDFGKHVLHLAAAELALDKVVDHAALDGAGTIERI